jgi:hypothetical protein
VLGAHTPTHRFPFSHSPLIVSIAHAVAWQVRGFGLSAAAACLLAGVLRFNESVTQLDVSENEVLRGAGLATLADALLRKRYASATQRRLAYLVCDEFALRRGETSLSLRRSAIGPATFALLAAVLRVNTELTNLDLGGNKLCGMSIERLIDPERGQLIRIVGSYQPMGLAALGIALRSNTTLTRLSLFDNIIGADGTHAACAPEKTPAANHPCTHTHCPAL